MATDERWTLTQGDSWPFGFVVRTQDGRPIFGASLETVSSRDESAAEANGRPQNVALRQRLELAASAPDLLAALKGVLRVADRATAEFDAARAALAKAEPR